MEKKLISAVVPCYNEEEAIPYFYDEIVKTAEKLPDYDFEFLFLNDGSRDKTLDILRELAAKDSRVRYISFSRNFGKEAAMYAGLENSKGDFVSFLDADLQDPPSLIPDMLNAIENEGYDAVSSRRNTRQGEPILRTFFAKAFYFVMNIISDTKMIPGARDFVFMNRKVADSLCDLKEYNRFTKGLFGWIGFKVKWLSYDNVQRVAGRTKWSFFKLFRYAVESIVSFTVKPLWISYVIGIPCILLSFVGFIAALCTSAFEFWISTLILFVGGANLFMLGITGSYLSRTYTEIKGRPKYICAETEKENPYLKNKELR